MTDILCLSTQDLRAVLNLQNVMDAVRQAYRQHSAKEGQTFPLIREKLSSEATFGVKAGYVPKLDILGLKAAGYWGRNRRNGVEAHQATVILLEPDTGKPRAFLDGNLITTLRTGAAGAVAVELFAKPNARVAAVLGTGVQGQIQTEGILAVRPGVTQVRCYGHSGASLAQFVEKFRHRVDVVVCNSPEEAVRSSDIVVTATPATVALVHAEYLQPGVHINAMGADTKGKQELHHAVLVATQVFADDVQQSRTIGECQHAPDCPVTEIGRVLLGHHPGRQRQTDITVFDSTGLALQDLTTAELAVQLAEQRGLGTHLLW